MVDKPVAQSDLFILQSFRKIIDKIFIMHKENLKDNY